MSELRKRMEALVTGPDARQEAADEASDGDLPLANLKPLIQQLLLGMQAIGLDSSNDDDVESYLKMLKMVATTKKAMFMTAMKQFSGSRATRAVKAAKMSL